MTVRRHLVEAGPAVGEADRGVGEAGDGLPGTADRPLEPDRVDGAVERIGRPGLVGPEQEHPAVPHPQVEAVLGEDGQRHVLGESGDGTGDRHLAAQRADREVDARERRDSRRPRSRGVDHGTGRDRARGRLDGGDAAAFDAQPCARLTVVEPHAEPLGGLDVAPQDLERPQEPVTRAEDAAPEAVEAHRRVDARDLVPADRPRIREPRPPLHLPRRRERVERLLPLGEEEISAGSEAGIDADLLGEAQQLLARQQRQTDVDFGAELRTKASRRFAGAALARPRARLDHADVRAPPRRQVPGDAGADDAGADDHHVRDGHGRFSSTGHGASLHGLSRPRRGTHDQSGADQRVGIENVARLSLRHAGSRRGSPA